MPNSALGFVAFLLTTRTCYAARAHGGHGGPPEAYRHITPPWQHSYLNSTTDCVTATAVGTSVSPIITSGVNFDQATVNAVNASLKFWWPARASEPASTVSIQFNTNDTSTGWTIYPATGTRLDLNYAVTSITCNAPTTTLTYTDLTFTPSNCDTLFPQVAASTSAISINAFVTPTVTTGYMTPIPDLQASSPPVSAIVDQSTFSTGTPFVQFSKYEVVKCQTVGTCVTSTYKLSAPYAFPYSGPNPANATNVRAAFTGKLDPAFPAYINRTSLIAGSWSGPSVVIVVVNEIIVAVAVLAATIEQSASALAVPTPILPPGFSAVPQTPVTTPTDPKVAATARVERTQTYLLLPGPPAPTPTTAPQTKKGDEIITYHPSPSTCASNCGSPARDVVVGGVTLTPVSIQVYVADGKTIYVGQSVSVAGCGISAPAEGTLLQVCGGTTSTMLVPPSGTFAAHGMSITATSGAGYAAPGHTIVAGGPGMTIGGLPVSMATGTGGLQIGKATQTVASTTTVTTSGGTTTSESAPSSTSSAAASHDETLLSTSLTLSACAILGWLWIIG